MKNAMLNFADRLLSKEQMKKVRGGVQCYFQGIGWLGCSGSSLAGCVQSCAAYGDLIDAQCGGCGEVMN